MSALPLAELIFRPYRHTARMGVGSVVVLLHMLGILGLVAPQ